MIFPSPQGWVPQWASYDVVLVNSSAGKDSQAMLHLVASELRDHGLLDRLVVVHCDLGRVEWRGTLDLAREQAAHYGARFEIVRRDEDLLVQIERRHHTLQQRQEDARALRASGLTTWAQVHHAGPQDVSEALGAINPEWSMQVEPEKRAAKVWAYARRRVGAGQGEGLVDFGAPVAWPSSQSRYCTSDQKTAQVRRLITQLHRETGNAKGFRVLNCLGLRAQESTARARKPSHSVDSSSTRSRHVDRWLPIHHWTEAQVWDVIRASGVRHHQAYDLGMSRLSCAFCIMASRRDLEIAAEHNPSLLATYIDLQDRVGSTFRPDLDLRALGAEPEAELQLPLLSGVVS